MENQEMKILIQLIKEFQQFQVIQNILDFDF